MIHISAYISISISLFAVIAVETELPYISTMSLQITLDTVNVIAVNFIRK